MATPYSLIIDSYLKKIEDYKMIVMTDDVIIEDAIDYMKSVCADFDYICAKDLSDRDDAIRKFTEDLSINEIDIIAKGMVVEWMRPIVYQSSAMMNVMNMKDASFFSPSKIMEQKMYAFEKAEKAYKVAKFNYSYDNGEIGDLHL